MFTSVDRRHNLVTSTQKSAPHLTFLRFGVIICFTSDYEDRDPNWIWAAAVGPQRDFNRGNRWLRVSR